MRVYKTILSTIFSVLIFCGGCFSPKGDFNLELTFGIPEDDIIYDLSDKSTDPVFIESMRLAREKQKSSDKDFVSLFKESFQQVDPNARLASVFLNEFKEKGITINSSNEELILVIRNEIKKITDRSFEILQKRIKYYSAKKSIHLETINNHIHATVYGINDPERAKLFFTGSAKLEFWETFENQEVYPYLLQANQSLKNTFPISVVKTKTTDSTLTMAEKPLTDTTNTVSLLEEIEKDTSATAIATASDLENFRKEYPLFAILIPNIDKQGNLFPGPVVGTAHAKDTAEVNVIMAKEQINAIFPSNMIFRWSAKPLDEAGNYYRLVALKSASHSGKALLTGDVIADARQEYDQVGGRPEIAIAMNSEGSKTWARMTKENIGRTIAIVFNDYVSSYPTVMNEITNGRLNITGYKSDEEAADLVNILKSGAFPYSLKIINEQITKRD
jgi:SecD/SecF fusion protein